MYYNHVQALVKLKKEALWEIHLTKRSILIKTEDTQSEFTEINGYNSNPAIEFSGPNKKE